MGLIRSVGTTESRIEQARRDKKATVWAPEKENHMASSSGPDGSTKRAAYYRERAAEARVKAEIARDYEARQTMLQVAGIWDYMAEIAEPHSRGPHRLGPFAT